MLWSWSYEYWPWEPSSPAFAQLPEIPPLDVWLIRGIYEVAAAESRCRRCGAPLGRRVRVVASASSGSSPCPATVV